ncbi:hypothetical protein OLMES_4322 [Oleiphilus messinensis]|uniref:Uncharacterized protein n=1 Tax=Oleiphilus messinensis TaxID=141451 RepID=A0A1Y0IDI7_9GAMM|nr:hypothetical protein OLMES_4322 [Oleiphilus messinensis]
MLGTVAWIVVTLGRVYAKSASKQMAAPTRNKSGSNYWQKAQLALCVGDIGLKFQQGLTNATNTFGQKVIKFRFITVAQTISPIFKQSVISAILRRMRVA